jgi:hypothetical protein
MAFANRRQIIASVAVLALLTISLIGVGVIHLPAKEATQNSATSHSGIGESYSAPEISNTTSQTTTLNTITVYDIIPKNSHLNCTLNDIPWPMYDSLANLIDSSKLVALANVTSATTVAVRGVPVTHYDVTIIKIFVSNPTGNATALLGSSLVIAQIGGTLNGTTMNVQGYPTLAVGGSYVLFANYAGFLAEYYEINLMTIGGPQGLFYVQNGNVYSLDNMYPQADAWLPVKADGVLLAQFVAEVQAASGSTTSTTPSTFSTTTSSNGGLGSLAYVVAVIVVVVLLFGLVAWRGKAATSLTTVSKLNAHAASMCDLQPG